MSDYVEIHEQIKDNMRTIESTVEIMFVNKIPFVISLGMNMKLTKIKNILDREAATLLKNLQSKKSVYTNKNIFIITLYMDNKFEVLHDILNDKGITLNTTAADKHVPQIERQIEVMKERIRSTWN